MRRVKRSRKLKKLLQQTKFDIREFDIPNDEEFTARLGGPRALAEFWLKQVIRHYHLIKPETIGLPDSEISWLTPEGIAVFTLYPFSDAYSRVQGSLLFIRVGGAESQFVRNAAQIAETYRYFTTKDNLKDLLIWVGLRLKIEKRRRLGTWRGDRREET